MKAGNPKLAIRDRALEMGFDIIGFAGPENGDLGQHLNSFLENGFHGDMGWLKATRDRRRSPRDLWADVQSVVAVGINYGPYKTL